MAASTFSTVVEGGSTAVLYGSPTSTSTIYSDPLSLFETIFSTDSSGETVASNTYYVPSTIVLSGIFTSPVRAPPASFYTSTITSEVSTTTLYGPILTSFEQIDTRFGGEFRTVTFYGPIGFFTINRVYTTTIGHPNTTTTHPTSSSTAPAGLSSGVKAGIGVGATLAFLIFAALVSGWLVFLRRRRAQPQNSEVVFSPQEGYNKPELDATESLKPGGSYQKPEPHTSAPTQVYAEAQDRKVELDATGHSELDARAELDGRMVPRADMIKRKEVAEATASSVVDEKDKLQEM
jgi:hypothetical protein